MGQAPTRSLWRSAQERICSLDNGGRSSGLRIPRFLASAAGRLLSHLRLYPPRASRTVPKDNALDACAERADSRLPAPGNILSRLYKGRLVHVRVLPKGFEYDGKIFKSLSAVAKVITGSHTSGFLFFRILGKGDSR